MDGTGKNIKNICARVGIMILMSGFFGLLYPDLCLTKDTCRVVRSAADGGEDTADEEIGLYYRLLSAKPDEIIIKSRLWEEISAYFRKK